MTLALSLFVLFYILMLAVQQHRPGRAGRGRAFLLLGKLGVYDFTLADAARAVDFNVLLMMAGMMGTVFLFIQSKMPARLAEELIAHVPDVRWAVSVLALLAGFISAFVDPVATVLMVAPVGLAIARRLKLIAGAGAHRHCGVVQFTGRGDAGRGHHEHPAGRLCGDEFLRFLLDGGSARHLLERGAGSAGLAGAVLAVPPPV